MRLAEPATVSNFESLKPLYVGGYGRFSDRLFLSFHIGVQMPLIIWNVPERECLATNPLLLSCFARRR